VKALTLWQPWASLVAVGAKRVETRGWSTRHRGPLAIHAAASIPREARWSMAPAAGFGGSPIRDALVAAGYQITQDRRRVIHDLPTGVVVATARLVDVVPTAELLWTDIGWPDSEGWHQRADRVTWAHDAQHPFGDFRTGRYAWLLDDLQPLDEPVPAKGRQGLWNWEGDMEVTV
jgi:hypothetical protein